MSKPYCGAKDKVPKGKHKGTEDECVSKSQVRYWGREAVTSENAKKVSEAPKREKKTKATKAKKVENVDKSEADIAFDKMMKKKTLKEVKKAVRAAQNTQLQKDLHNVLKDKTVTLPKTTGKSLKKTKEIIRDTIDKFYKKKEPEPEPEPEPEEEPELKPDVEIEEKVKIDEPDDDVEIVVEEKVSAKPKNNKVKKTVDIILHAIRVILDDMDKWEDKEYAGEKTLEEYLDKHPEVKEEIDGSSEVLKEHPDAATMQISTLDEEDPDRKHKITPKDKKIVSNYIKMLKKLIASNTKGSGQPSFLGGAKDKEVLKIEEDHIYPLDKEDAESFLAQLAREKQQRQEDERISANQRQQAADVAEELEDLPVVDPPVDDSLTADAFLEKEQDDHTVRALEHEVEKAVSERKPVDVNPYDNADMEKAVDAAQELLGDDDIHTPHEVPLDQTPESIADDIVAAGGKSASSYLDELLTKEVEDEHFDEKMEQEEPKVVEEATSIEDVPELKTPGEELTNTARPDEAEANREELEQKIDFIEEVDEVMQVPPSEQTIVRVEQVDTEPIEKAKEEHYSRTAEDEIKDVGLDKVPITQFIDLLEDLEIPTETFYAPPIEFKAPENLGLDRIISMGKERERLDEIPNAIRLANAEEAIRMMRLKGIKYDGGCRHCPGPVCGCVDGAYYGGYQRAEKYDREDFANRVAQLESEVSARMNLEQQRKKLWDELVRIEEDRSYARDLLAGPRPKDIERMEHDRERLRKAMAFENARTHGIVEDVAERANNYLRAQQQHYNERHKAYNYNRHIQQIVDRELPKEQVGYRMAKTLANHADTLGHLNTRMSMGNWDSMPARLEHQDIPPALEDNYGKLEQPPPQYYPDIADKMDISHEMAAGRRERRASIVQSVLIPTSWGASRALKWIDSHGYKSTKVDPTKKYLRFRQMSPNKFDRFWTQTLSNGVRLVHGYV